MEKNKNYQSKDIFGKRGVSRQPLRTVWRLRLVFEIMGLGQGQHLRSGAEGSAAVLYV